MLLITVRTAFLGPGPAPEAPLVFPPSRAALSPRAWGQPLRGRGTVTPWVGAPTNGRGPKTPQPKVKDLQQSREKTRRGHASSHIPGLTRDLGKCSQGRTPNQTQNPDAHLGNLQAPKPLETQRQRGSWEPRGSQLPRQGSEQRPDGGQRVR